MADRTARFLTLALAALVFAPSEAWAHQMNIFATVKDRTIQGRVYFRGGAAARDVSVTAYDPAGRQLGQAKTDAKGNFVLPVDCRCDHRLLVDTGDGHGAETTITAARLPADLPGCRHDHAPAPADPGTTSVDPLPTPEETLRAQLAAVRGDLAELERQLDEMQHSTQLRDMLGGIGYIFGIAGVAFYLLARRAGPKP